MTTTPPAAWAILEQALIQRRPVQADYHGQQRLLSPHAIGWKNGRPKVLSYQATNPTDPATDPRQQWRSMFIDDIQNATITNHTWQTADNYTPNTNGIDHLHLAVSQTN